MSFTKIAVIVGIILSIPILFMIQFGSNQLEQNAQELGDLRRSLAELDASQEEMYQSVDGIDISDPELDPEPESNVFPYPIKRNITNFAGSTIRVTITGRSQSELKFHSANSFYYSYPIKRLSLKDQEFARSLPVVSR